MNEEDSPIRNLSAILIGVAGRIIIIALLVLGTFVAVNFGFRLGYSIFCADSVDEAPGKDVEIVIEKGETVDELSKQLYEHNIIPNEYAFRIQARLYDVGVYPGTYKVNTSMSTKEILKTIDKTEQEYLDDLALEASSEENEDGIIAGGDEGSDSDGGETSGERSASEADGGGHD